MRDPEKELTALKERVAQLERVLIFGAPLEIQERVVLEALERRDMKTVSLYLEQRKQQESARTVNGGGSVQAGLSVSFASDLVSMG